MATQVPWWQQEGLASDPGISFEQYKKNGYSITAPAGGVDSSFGATGGSSSTQFNFDGTQNTTGKAAGAAPAGLSDAVVAGDKDRVKALTSGASGGTSASKVSFDPNAALGTGTNQALINKGADIALNQTGSKTLPMVSDLAQKLISGAGSEAYQQQAQAQMDAYNKQLANKYEQARQQNADLANTGAMQGDMLDLALRNESDRATMGADLNMKARQAQIDEIVKALSEGRATGQAENQNITDMLQNLSTAQGMGESTQGRLFNAEMAKYDAAIKEAQDNKDFEQENYLLDKKLKAEVEARTANFSQQEKMAYLNNKFETAMKSGDYAQAERLKKMEYQFTATESAKDRVLAQARIDLEKRGVDMKEVEQRFEQLMAMEENGTARPGSAVAYVNQQLKGSGVSVEMPDPNQMYTDLQNQYNGQKFQYLLSHPESGQINYSDPKVTQALDEVLGAGNWDANDASGQNMQALLESNPSLIGLDARGNAFLNDAINSTMWNQDAVDNMASTFAKDGVNGVVSALGGGSYSASPINDAKQLLVASRAPGLFGRKENNIVYENIARMTTSGLNGLLRDAERFASDNRLSPMELSNMRNVISSELSRRTNFTDMLNASNLTPEQRRQIMATLPLLV